MADTEMGAAVDEESGDTDAGSRSRARWRLPVALLLIAALVGGAAGLVVRYRHDHRNQWSHDTEAWRGFDVSDDGRTLTFHGWGSGDCTEATGVTFSSDPTAGGQITATLDSQQQVVRDGHAVFCTLGLGIDTPVEPVTFDQPVPEGTVITDGATTFDPMFCLHAVSQVVHAPTTLGATVPC